MNVPTTRNAASISSAIHRRGSAAIACSRSARRREAIEQLVEVVSRKGGQMRIRSPPRALSPMGPVADRKTEMSRDMEHPRPGSAIASPAAAPGNPFPSQRSKTYARFEDNAGAEAEPAAKRCATSQCRANVERAISSAFSSAWATASRTSGGHHVVQPRPSGTRRALRGCLRQARSTWRAALFIPEELRLLGRVQHAAEG